MANEMEYKASETHPSDFNTFKTCGDVSATGIGVGGSKAVAARRTEAAKVRLDKCQRDSECVAIDS